MYGLINQAVNELVVSTAGTPTWEVVFKETKVSSRDPMVEHPLHRLISETVALCQARLRDGHVELLLSPLSPLWTIECHAPQISQVLVNLLNNAYDAISNLDQRWIRIETSDSGDSITIRVIDSGNGIAPHIAKRIMSPPSLPLNSRDGAQDSD